MIIRASLKCTVVGVLILFVAGCMESRSKVHAVFIDYTQSASVFRQGNPEKVSELLKDLAGKMEPDDVLELYPIHAYTESATHVLRLKGPPLQGDLRDRQRLIKWKERTAADALDRVWNMGFSKDRTASTNIYPVVRKMSRLLKAGYMVKAYLVCDMIQDFDGEDFSILLREGSDADPGMLAHRKVADLGFIDMLQGVDVEVLIPGTPHGNQAYDRIRAEVIAFWQTFFIRCGAAIVIRDL